MASRDPTGSGRQSISVGPAVATSAVCRDPSDVVRLYSQVAWAYEAWVTIADSRVRRLVRDAVRRPGAGSIVEAGCGTGALLIKLALDNPDGHTVGLELAPGMVMAAQRRIDRQGLSSVDTRRTSRTSASPTTALTPSRPATCWTSCPSKGFARPSWSCGECCALGGGWRSSTSRSPSVGATTSPNCCTEAGCPSPPTAGRSGVAPLLVDLGFVDVTRRYVSQIGLPSELVSATNGPSGI